MQGVCSQQGCGPAALHPSASNLGCAVRAVVCLQQGKHLVLPQGRVSAGFPSQDRSKISQAARYQPLTHFYICLIDEVGKSAAISLLLVCSNTQYPKSFRLKTQWHGWVFCQKTPPRQAAPARGVWVPALRWHQRPPSPLGSDRDTGTTGYRTRGHCSAGITHTRVRIQGWAAKLRLGYEGTCCFRAHVLTGEKKWSLSAQYLGSWLVPVAALCCHRPLWERGDGCTHTWTPTLPGTLTVPTVPCVGTVHSRWILL